MAHSRKNDMEPTDQDCGSGPIGMPCRLIFGLATDGFFVFDEDRRICEANASFAKMLGYGVEAIRDLYAWDIDALYPTREKILEQWPELSRDAGSIVTVLKRQNGSTFDAEISYTPFEWEGRRYLFMACRDITERKRIQDDLEFRKMVLSTHQKMVQDAVLVVDQDGMVASYNQQFIELWHIPEEVARQKEDEPLLQWAVSQTADPKRFLEKVRYLYDHREESSFDEITLADGRTIERFSAPMLGTDHHYYGRVWHFRDISERKHNEAALRESQERLRRALENIPDAVVIYDRNGCIQYANAATQKLTKRPPSYFIGRRDEDLWPPEVTNAYLPWLRKAIEEGTPQNFIAPLDFPGIPPQTVQIHIQPILAPGGEVQEVLAITHDLTKRLGIEAELREAKERLHQAVETGKVGLWDWDLITNEIYYSPEWRRMLGYAEDESPPDGFNWAELLPPDDREDTYELLQRFLGSTQGAMSNTFEAELRLRHKDGNYLNVLARGRKVVDEHGTPIRLIGSNVDITERTELQAMLMQSQKMESIGRLAGGIAHDFNNVLTLITGMAEFSLVKLKEGDPLKENLEEIHRAGARAASLTRQLLAFSRRQIMKPDVIDLNMLISEMSGMLHRLIGENIELQFVPGAELSFVLADPGLIEQVVMNLAVNARDAMPDGGLLTIETRETPLDEAFCGDHPPLRPGHYIVLAVSDNGAGMDEKTRRRIFEPFFTTKPRGKGTGLGLSTVYGIVQQSGGIIDVHSEPGCGTVFKVYLPWVDLESGEPGAAKEPPISRGTETILLVEDDEALRNLARRLLDWAGYTIMPATTGEEALQLFKGADTTVDLLLTDVVLPGINGRELSEAILTISPNVKVLFTSGYTDDAILRHGVLGQTTNFLGKPYTIAELTSKVRETLDNPPPLPD